MTSGSDQRDLFGPVSLLPLTRIQQFVGRRMHEVWTQIPHVTHFETADVTEIEAARRQFNEQNDSPRLTLLAYIVSATILALKEMPRLCASLAPDGKALVLKQYINMGIAVETPQGLLVPVIAGADGLSLRGIGESVRDIAERGRNGSLRPDELEGSSFTISSIGSVGGVGFTPIINAPNVAILGVSQARLQPACIDGKIAARFILPLSLSYDHRVIDGADAARFCTFLRNALADPKQFRF